MTRHTDQHSNADEHTHTHIHTHAKANCDPDSIPVSHGNRYANASSTYLDSPTHSNRHPGCGFSAGVMAVVAARIEQRL